jgi:3-deoxy-D-manno-octulosonic-acid transferase
MFFYTAGIFFYRLLIGLASPFHSKANKMLKGRKGLFKKLEELKNSRGNSKLIWFHVASLGEFEQGKPVIEKLKQKDPSLKILLTFFSPSGYEVKKNYEKADYIFYIPFDFPGNAARFLELTKPDAAVFVKYEFWLNFLYALDKRKVPVYLVSAVFHQGQPFFRWYGNRFINALHLYKYIFVQDKHSFDLLSTLKVKNKSISGDTRFDRVLEIAGQAKDLEEIENFGSDHFVIVMGSSYAKEEELMLAVFLKLKAEAKKIKLIIAPHEIHESNIMRLTKSLTEKKIPFSVFTKGVLPESEVIVINNIGLLSSLYRYGKIAYVGGGFADGIHNILEAAVYGMPVFFGPNYFKFNEADLMISKGAAFSIKSENELHAGIKSFLEDKEKLNRVSEKAADFVKSSAGASELVVEKIFADNLF